MKFILCSEPNFNEKWGFNSIVQYLDRDSKVVILPLVYDEGWSFELNSFEKGSKSYDKLIQPFLSYLIKENNISFFDVTYDSLDKIKQADVLYLVGDNPLHMMERINDLGLREVLCNYDGILITNHAGSQVVMDEFMVDDESYHGLSLLNGFDLISEYVEDVEHLGRLINSIEYRGKAVFAFPKKGGVIIDDGHYELLGDAFTCSENDLDNIYNAYRDAQSRQEYYGDNGNY